MDWRPRRSANSKNTPLSSTAKRSRAITAAIPTSRVYANAIYRWDAFYLPFGINFLLPKVEDGPLIFKNKSGSVGGQVGAGYYVHENFATEFVVRASHVNLGGVASGTNYYSYGDGYLFSANLIAKFIY
ncbi:MAG: hypothetical protein EOP05_23910 [Proteobacteria bacterium]|nr:MAG: hypothetical protein EOP05_23910 [Pseudomonadota bacterium]